MTDRQEIWLWCFTAIVGSCPFEHPSMQDAYILKRSAEQADKLTDFVVNRFEEKAKENA